METSQAAVALQETLLKHGLLLRGIGTMELTSPLQLLQAQQSIFHRQTLPLQRQQVALLLCLQTQPVS